jgi:hypothetical protein
MAYLTGHSRPGELLVSLNYLVCQQQAQGVAMTDAIICTQENRCQSRFRHTLGSH